LLYLGLLQEWGNEGLNNNESPLRDGIFIANVGNVK